jgi:putative hemolysin
MCHRRFFALHSPYSPSSGLHTLHARYPAARAATREANSTRFSGFVRLPDGQLGRQ